MARPRKFEHNEVLKEIKNVFWDKGYEGTSYPDLIKASGLHKGSLYAAFGDKRALYLKALQNYDEHEVSQAIALLTGQMSEIGKPRIETLFDMVIDAVKVDQDYRGCLLCNAAVDQAIHNQEVKVSVSSGMEKMLNAFTQSIRDEHPHIKDRDIEKSASHINAVYFGLRVMAKSGVNITMLEQARDSAVNSIM